MKRHHKQGDSLGYYCFFLVIFVLPMFFQISRGNANKYFPGQASFKSLPRMGRRNGEDFISGRPTSWSGYRAASLVNRKTPYETMLENDPKESNWDFLLYGNRNGLSADNRMAFSYDPARGIHRIIKEKESPIEYSNGDFSLNNVKK